MLIFLVCFMGSGKSTVGKKLAARLQYDFVDLDKTIELIAGKSIAAIFDEEGESYFRSKETEVLRSLDGRKNLVVSTGGGTPCHSENMQWMNENGITVYLEMHPGSIYHRIGKHKKERPLIRHLGDVELMEFIINELDKRKIVYRKANLVMKGESLKTEELEQQLLLLMKK